MGGTGKAARDTGQVRSPQLDQLEQGKKLRVKCTCKMISMDYDYVRVNLLVGRDTNVPKFITQSDKV